MENIKKIARELKAIRGEVPQFLFVCPVMMGATVELRRKVIEYKKANPESKEIDFILQSPGGLADDAYRIIRTLRKNFDVVNVIVPFWAKSAATLLSLGATRIVMDEFGELGPLDAQIAKQRDDSPEFERESALNDELSVSRIETRFKEMYEAMYIRLYENDQFSIPKTEISKQLLENLSRFYEPLLAKIDPYKLGEKRRSLDIGAQYSNRVIGQFHPKINVERRRQLVDFLVDGCPDHGYIVDYDIMSRFVDFVSTGKEFAGDDYADKLTELSLEFIGLEQSEIYIGFIDEEQVEESDEQQLGSSLSNPNLEAAPDGIEGINASLDVQINLEGIVGTVVEITELSTETAENLVEEKDSIVG